MMLSLGILLLLSKVSRGFSKESLLGLYFEQDQVINLLALFASLIIRLFQLIFSVGTVFFSHNKSAEKVFQLDFGLFFSLTTYLRNIT